MKTFAVLILTLILVTSAKATEPDFKNQGEQEDYWAEELFKKDHNEQHYQRYKGPIIINGDTFGYSDKVLTVYTTPELKAIFEKGLFYPEIIEESFKYRPKIKITGAKDTTTPRLKKDTSIVMQNTGHDLEKPASLTIYNLEELKSLETSPRQKRFRFWLQGRYPIANATVYFMELTNENATSSTDLATFINGAKLTFFEEGWLII